MRRGQKMANLVGPDGKPISSKAKPDYNQIAVVSIRDRWTSYPSQGLTPEKLARIFREADEGDVNRQMELFEEMEGKDTHLFSEMQKRKQAVLGLDYEIMPYSDSPIDKKAAQLVRDAMEFEGLEDALLDILDAIGKGFSVTEIMWMLKNSQVMVNKLEYVLPKRITFPYHAPNDYYLITDEASMGIPLPENKFIIHRHKAKSGHPSGAGIIRVCAWMYLFKNYSIKDWVIFAEVYGMPLRLGKYDTSSSQADKDALIQAVMQLGTDAAGIISKSTEIEFVNAMKTSDSNIHEALASFCNREMSKAILGQTLTTEVGSTGSYAASQTHNEVRRDLTKADAKALAETLRRYLFHPLVRFNLGDEPNLPWMKYDLSEPEDQEKSAKIYSILIKDINLPVGKKHVYEKFGIPEPEAGEEILQPVQSQPGENPLPLKMSFKDGQEYFLRQVRAQMHAHKAVNPMASPNPQDEVDALADRAAALAAQVMQSLLQTVRDLVESGASLEEIQEQLPQLYQEMDISELQDLIARALFVADLYGRWVANAEA